MRNIKRTILKFHFSTWFIKPYLVKNNISKDESFEIYQFSFLFFTYAKTKSSS